MNNCKRVWREYISLPLFDKIFDVALFLGTVCVTTLHAALKDDPFTTLQLALNIAASLTLFLSHLLFKPSALIGGLPLTSQKYIDIIVLFGSIGGQYLNLYRFYQNYDTATHLVTGCIVCLIACEVYRFYAKQPPYCKPTLCATYCFFMSMTVSLLWEIFEFTSDFFFGGVCQGYNATLETEKFFYFRWFSFAKRPELQYALYDTFADVIAGTLAAFLTAVILAAVLKKQQKKQAQIKEAVPVRF